MVIFLKNNFKFHSHRILIKCFKIYIFHNSFIKICGYILFFMRKYKKIFNSPGNLSEEMNI